MTLLLMVSATSNQIMADNLQSSGKASRTPIVIHQTRMHKGSRPKAPSRQHVECFYEDGIMTVSFLIPEGDCVMTVTDNVNGETSYYDFESGSPVEISVGELDEATIQIDTALGYTYTGILE